MTTAAMTKTETSAGLPDMKVSVRQVSAAVLKKPFATSGPAVGWVGETAARPQTASPVLAELSFPTMELYAMPAATSAFLDDAAVDRFVDLGPAEHAGLGTEMQSTTTSSSGTSTTTSTTGGASRRPAS